MSPLLKPLSILAALSSVGLLAAGALVNSQQAALSVPDWPLSYGKWILIGEWSGTTVYEHTHRLFAVLTAVVLAGFLPVLWRAFPKKPVRRAVSWTATLFLAQVLLGGAVVLLLDPPWLASIHILIAQVFTCLVLGLALFPFGVWGGATSQQGSGLQRKQVRLAHWVLALLVLQTILGILSRHPMAQASFIVSLLAHMAAGLILVIVIPIAVVSISRRAAGGTRWAALALGTFVGLQLLVAVPLLFVSPEPLNEEWPPPEGFPELHVAHVVLATLLAFTAIVLHYRVKQEAQGYSDPPLTDS